MDGRAIPAAQVPLLARTRLEAIPPQEGDEVPGLPASFKCPSVAEVDEVAIPGSLVVWASVWVPGQGEGLFTSAGVVLPEVVLLTNSGRAWVDERIAQAQQMGWTQVASEADLKLPGEWVVATGGAAGVQVSQAPGPRILSVIRIHDDVAVQTSGRDDHGPYLVLEGEGGPFEADWPAGRPAPAQGTRGRLSGEGFTPYPDQSLHRRPDLDDGDHLGWETAAQPQGFTAPRQDVPGT